MWICPNCGKKVMDRLICPGCKFDETRNYADHPVLVPIGKAAEEAYRSMLVKPEGLYYRAIACWQLQWRTRPLQLLEQAAAAGKKEAMTVLGWICENGLDDKEKVEQYGREVLVPIQIPPDRPAAHKWYRKAAGEGEPIACCILGAREYFGEQLAGIARRDEEKAYAWFDYAAARGDALGTYWCGICCYLGKGIDRSYEKAYNYFCTAAEKGLDYAVCMKAVCLMYGYGTGKKAQPQEAMKLLETVTDTVPVANFWMGHACEEVGSEESLKAARKWYERSVQLGIPEGNIWLAFLYLNGKGGPKDSDAAFACLQAARDEAEEKEYRAVRLRPVSKDKKAWEIPVPLFSPPAVFRKGFRQSELGSIYYSRNEYEKALEAFEASAEAGSVTGMSWLGYFYKTGKGLPAPDLQKAGYWFRKAADAGDEYSQNQLKALEDSMSSQEAEKLRKGGAAAGTSGKGSSSSADTGSAAAKGQMESGSRGDGTSVIEPFRLTREQKIEKCKDSLNAGQYSLAIEWAHQVGDISGKFLPAGHQCAYGYALYRESLSMTDAAKKEEWQKYSYKCFQTAAGKGDTAAIYHMGYFARRGIGTEKNLKSAREWIKLSLERYRGKLGYENRDLMPFGDALYEYGNLLITTGKKPDDVNEGLKALQQAADEGHVQARMELVDYYLEGSVTKKDYARAEELLKKGMEWPGDSINAIRMRMESKAAMEKFRKIPGWKKLLGL